MSGLNLTKEEVLAKAAEEFETQKQLEEEEKKSRSEFASKVLTGLRYPATAPLHQQGDFASIYDQLEDHEIHHLTLLRKQYGAAIHSVVLAPNKGTKDLGSYMVSYDPTARIKNLHDVIDTKAPFSHTLVVPIEGIATGDLNDLDEKSFRKQYADTIRHHLSEFTDNSPSVFEHLDSSLTSHRDLKEWETFLPSSKSNVGIYRHDGRFFLIANSHAGKQATIDLKTILETSGMTMEAFATDPRVCWIRKMAYRNCARLLHDVACKLQMKIPCANDLSSYLHAHKKPCRMAHPLVSSVHNTVGRDIFNNVVCYHRCSDPRQGNAGLLIASNPYHGYVHLNPSGARPCGIHLYPAFTSHVCKKKRQMMKPAVQKKCMKKVYYSRESKRCRTQFSREVYSPSCFERISRFFGLPERHAQKFAPVFVYSS